jgi:putative spermidine/putrescine transport system permease protein
MRWNKHIVFAFGMVFLLLPIALLLMLAFATEWRFPDVLPAAYTLDHAKLAFSGGRGIMSPLILSLGIGALVSITCVALALFISRMIALHPKRNLLLFIAYLPFVLSPVIYAACVNYYFVLFGWSGTFMGICIAQSILIFPYNVILFQSHWNNSMEAYGQLSATLGAGKWQTWRYVWLPMSKQMVLIALFQSFIVSWFEFGLTNFIGAGKVQTLTIRVYQYIGEANIYLAAFSSLILILPPLVLLWINKKFVLRNY